MTHDSTFSRRSALRIGGIGMTLAALTFGTNASAQQPPPPPPGYAPAPQSYGPPPQGYAPPPAGGYYYAPAPAAAAPGPRRLDYDEGEPVPAGYRVVEKPRRGLVIAGAVTFGVTYGISLMFSLLATAADENGGYEALMLPGIGPFIGLATIDDQNRAGTQALVLDGVIQCGGLAMLIGGFAFPKKELLRNDVGGLQLTLQPMVAPTVGGLSLHGSL